MLEPAALAARISKAIADSPYSQEAIAREFGITEQAVSGWVRTGKIAKGKLPMLAQLTGKPLEYFMVADVEGTSYAAPAIATAIASSQLQRPDPAILIETLDFLEKAFGALGKEFSLRADADLFADAYEWLAEDDRPVDERNLVHFAEWRARHEASAGGTTDADESRDADTEAPGKDRRRAG